MGVRPPTGDSTDDPDTLAFGIAALDPHLDGVEFPVTAEELVERTGDPAVPYDAAGSEVRLSEAVAETRSRRFESERRLLDELHPVFEERRERASLSVIARLRGLLPF
ncbi:hypothetical protein [Halosegnis marinus]|uniref:DUF2795 domain-containing protein n=1 Tax=Halosegnis marinus TaxID=3034023 RepID=A0ABD5ZLA8_9EURY|nr:hypothetical protein [Halosegnis sp. DT85]